MFSAAFDKPVYGGGKYCLPSRAAFTSRCKPQPQMPSTSPRQQVMFSVAFDKPVYGEGKYYLLSRASFTP
ncbi:MAG: hypothetical protein E7201_03550 [Selenomonas ruminantium]|uniref:Uncharacterized protein n=1 Tax=Selenomonas ruminantium TaxID=971 RepID=A0A927ZQW2_SELRU|nr:hypothetical protein [Selenomonas ruminantium]